MRTDGRAPDHLRPVNTETKVLKYAEGSALISMGDTRVLCAASVLDETPRFLRESSSGWVTAEYALLPRSTQERVKRESERGRISGRTHEIQRLIGRSLRSVVDLEALGPRTIQLDCDVIQADGGTRTAAITGAFVALAEAVHQLLDSGAIHASPIREAAAAVSVGILNDEPILDLDYSEDSTAEVDMNIVMTTAGKFVEIQGTAERAPFHADHLQHMLSLAEKGIQALFQHQTNALGHDYR